MRRQKNFGVCVRASWLLACLGTGVMAVAQSFLPAADGWYSWAIDAGIQAQRCCYHWNDGKAGTKECDLDATGTGGRSHDRGPTSHDAIVYVKKMDGDITQVHALSASCQVRTDTPIMPLDDIAADRSVALLRALVTDDEHLSSAAMSAVALHEVILSSRALLALARDHADEDVRSKAWFWLAQTQWTQTELSVLQALSDESSHDTRQHAVFALSQLSGERSADALIRVIETPSFDQRDRKQALFWLAEDKNDKSLEYLSEILR